MVCLKIILKALFCSRSKTKGNPPSAGSRMLKPQSKKDENLFNNLSLG